MIKINEQLSINKYKYGWELHHSTPSKDKHGNDSTAVRTTYHPNIKKVLSAALDCTAGECKEISDIIGAFDLLVNEFQVALAKNEVEL